MTPLRFRAWHKIKKEWMVVQPSWMFDKRIFTLYIPDEELGVIKVMQSTGLTDSNGREIFEGDVVRWDDASGGKYWRVAQVVWSDCGGWCFRTIPSQCVDFLKDEIHDFEMGNFIYTPDTSAHGNVMEVIGNIYENPNLLE